MALPSVSTKDMYETTFTFSPSHLLEDLLDFQNEFEDGPNGLTYLFLWRVENRGTSCQAESQQDERASEQADCIREGDRQGGFWVRSVCLRCMKQR